MTNPATYSSKINTDIPLYESPAALFDEYMEDKRRVFKAIFPDKLRSQQVSEVSCVKFHFLFASAELCYSAIKELSMGISNL